MRLSEYTWKGRCIESQAEALTRDVQAARQITAQLAAGQSPPEGDGQCSIHLADSEHDGEGTSRGTLVWRKVPHDVHE